MTTPAKSRSDGIIAALLLGITLAVFWPVQWHDFLQLDDDAYVYENPHVNTGLTAANLKWAFTAMHSGNWHLCLSLDWGMRCDAWELTHHCQPTRPRSGR